MYKPFIINMKDKIEIKKIHWQNGQLMYETPYNKNGLVHGLAKGWHENGKLWHEISYNKNGLCHGLAKGWHYNEQLWYETPYKNGQPHGAKIDFKY